MLLVTGTRFLVLLEPGAIPNLASRFLSVMTHHLYSDWLAVHGRGMLVTEMFCDMSAFAFTMLRAENWGFRPGETKGNGGAHAKSKPRNLLKHHAIAQN
ncbi:MAG: DUF4338 domain-containing protein [Roseovarius sp.]|nr:DUF4338 domain-containing protein [Roseovarius sp.]